MATEARQKIPVPRRSFLWSLNETSGEILMHVGPTEFTPSANDRIVRSNDRGGFEQAPMEARPFVMARDGEYVVLCNPVKDGGVGVDGEAKNGSFIAGGNKEKELVSGTKRIIPGPCSFPLWPGQSAEVRPAHKLGANQYLLVEVVGDIEERAPYYRLVIESAGLSSAVIDQAGEGVDTSPMPASSAAGDGTLRLGQRIVIQGRHTQLFIPPSGIEIVPPIEESEPKEDAGEDAISALPAEAAAELNKLTTLVREGMTQKQLSTLKSELRHRQDLPLAHRAIFLAAVDHAFEARQHMLLSLKRGKIGSDRERQRSGPSDPYARRAVLLGPKEFCILFDADGNPRIVRGPARVFPGPHDTFLQRGSRRRVYDAYELSEHQALWLRVITPISRDRLRSFLPPGFPLEREEYDAGADFIVRGRPSVFVPFIEAEVVNPSSGEPHVGNDHDAVIIPAIGIDQKSGVYVRDLRTGMVKMVRGETSYLVDPRSEELVQRRVPATAWNLWVAHAEPHKRTTDDAVTTPWAVSVVVPNNEACLVASRHGRRVEIGPKVVLLEFEEQLVPLTLSKGPSKDGHQTQTTCFLRVQGGRVSDTFEIESSDFVKLRIKLGFTGHFEGDPETWFSVDDPVKLLADDVRARLRAVARKEPVARLVREMAAIVKETLFGTSAQLRFATNGMVIDACELLKVDIVDPALAELFTSAQREAVKLQINDEQATRRLLSERHQDAIDAEEHAIVRSAVARKAESRAVDAEADHRVDLRKLELKFDIADAELQRTRTQKSVQLDDELRAAERRAEAQVERRRKEAEGDALANEAVYKVEEAHLAKMAALELERARVLAEAEALRLKAIQPELIGALHSAADAEVMKAAATNMNLVSLLGGKSPQELFEHVLRGTPLERSTRDMRARSEGARKNGDPSAE